MVGKEHKPASLEAVHHPVEPFDLVIVEVVREVRGVEPAENPVVVLD